MASVAVTLPGILGLGLALTYLLGAAALTSEYIGEGIEPATALGLLSVERILIRGVGVLVEPIAIVAMVQAGAALAYLPVRRRLYQKQTALSGQPSSRDLPKQERQRIRLVLKWFLVVSALALAVGAVFGRPGGLIGLAPLSVILIYGAYLRRWVGTGDSDALRVGFSRLLAITAASALLAVGLLALFTPSPLPEATIDLENGRSIEGPFIGHEGSTWYIAGSQDEVTALPERTISDVSLAETDPDDGKRNYEYVIDLF